MLETGAVSTVREIATKEKINSSYVSRVLRLTLLAPEIVEAILDGRQPVEVTLPGLMEVFPVVWDGQFQICSPRVRARFVYGRGVPTPIGNSTH